MKYFLTALPRDGMYLEQACLGARGITVCFEAALPSLPKLSSPYKHNTFTSNEWQEKETRHSRAVCGEVRNTKL